MTIIAKIGSAPAAVAVAVIVAATPPATIWHRTVLLLCVFISPALRVANPANRFALTIRQDRQFRTRRHLAQDRGMAAPARSGRYYGVFLTPVSLQGPRLRLIGASDLRLYGAINGSTPSPANSAGDGGYGDRSAFEAPRRRLTPRRIRIAVA